MGIDFEDILKTVGDFGRYQKFLICVFLFPVSAFAPAFFFSYIFMNSSIDHWCYVPEVAEYNLSLSDQLSLIRPQTDPQCTTFDVNFTDVLRSANLTPSVGWTTKACTDGLQFDKTDYKETAISRWGMVCEYAFYSSLVASMMFASNSIGTLFYGFLSNVLGKRKIFFVMCLTSSISEIGSSLIPNFTAFFVLRVINGSIMSLMYVLGYVTILEMVGTSRRTTVNALAISSWSIGLCLVPLLAWSTGHWVRLSVIQSIIALSFLVYWKILPESPRWLISKRRYSDAFEVLEKLKNSNGCQHQDSGELKALIIKYGKKIEKDEENRKSSGVVDILKYPRIRKIFFLITLCWISSSCLYTGFLVNINNLSGNKFLNYFLLSILEIPSHLVTWFSMERLGRRWTLISGQCLVIVSCLSVVALPSDLPYVDVIASIFGRFGTSSAYMTLYQQAPELMPTPLRIIGISISSTIGVSSALAAPFISDLVVYGKHYPFLIYSILSFMAMLTALFLPETLNRRLPETIEDAEIFRIHDKFFSCGGKLSEDEEDCNHNKGQINKIFALNSESIIPDNFIKIIENVKTDK